MADEMIYETTIQNYESVIGALPENTRDTPYTVRITDVNNIVIGNEKSNIGYSIREAKRYVSIIWNDGAEFQKTDAFRMFKSCYLLINIDTSPFVNITSAIEMFSGCTYLKTIDTSPFMNVTETLSMFAYCNHLEEINVSSFSNVTVADRMFESCNDLTKVEGISFYNSTSVSYMFNYCTKLTAIDISSFEKVKNANFMFNNCENLKDITLTNRTSSALKEYILKLTDVTLQWTVYTTIADYATELKALPQNTVDTPYDVIVLDAENIVKTTSTTIVSGIPVISSNIRDAISSVDRYVNIDWDENTYWGGVDAEDMFIACNQIISIKLKPFLYVTEAPYMLQSCRNLVSVDTTGMNKVINGNSMFDECSNLESVNIQNFSKIEDATTMFLRCAKLKTIDISSFKNVEILDSMFSLCESLESIVAGNFSKVSSATTMFKDCVSLKSIDTSTFTNVKDATAMFRGCSNLNFIDVTPFYNVEIVKNMFADIENLTIYNVNDNLPIRNYLATLEGVNVIDTIETTIDDYEEKVGLLSDNRSPTSSSHPSDYIHNIKITDPENISYQIKEGTEDKRIWNINTVIQNTARYVNISFLEGSEWAGTDATSLFSTKFLCGIDSSVFKNVSNATEMFITCTNLKKINTVGFRNVINANEMFQVCTALKEIDTSNFINVKDITRMFRGVTLNGFDVSPLVNVEIADEIFMGNRTPIIVSSMEHPFNSAIAEYLEDKENKIKFLDEVKFYFPYSYKIYLPESLWGKEIECNIVEDLPKITPLKFYALNVSSLEKNTMENPYPVMITEATDKTSEDFHAGMDGATNYTEVSFEDDVKYIDIRGAKVTDIELSNLERLEYLDVSETDITELNLRETSLTYCEFDDDHKLIKGWLAQNCKMLKKVTALQKQVQDKNLNLENDTNACIGCDSLQEVEVLCDEEPKYDGKETHYSKVSFENDLFYKGKRLEELIPDTPLTEDYLVQLIIKNSGILGELRYFPDTDFHRGFLYCDGSVFLPEVYPDFFALWKIHFEKDCGYDRFGYPRLPDYRGMFIRGGEKGRDTYSFQKDAIKKHEHLIEVNTKGNPDGWGDYGRDYWSNHWGSSEPSTHTPAGTFEDETRPKNIASNIYIKVI